METIYPTDFFTTIIQPSILKLTNTCNDMIKNGWIPLGNPVITPSGEFTQCFYKEYTEVEDTIKETPKKKGKKNV